MMSDQTNKKPGDIGWLLQLAEKKKTNILFACLFSVLSAALSFAPYICVYFILKEILKSTGNLAAISFGSVGIYAWIALGAVMISLLLSFLSSVLSHGAAYKILFELRMRFAQHISKLPMGFHTSNSTGKLRKLMDDNVEKIELFIAHQLPDAIGSLASPVVMLAVLFLFDWKMGLACLVPIVLGFIAQASSLSNPKSKEFMESFQNLQDKMNSSAVEYVRGIYVVKAFNQTVFSFHNQKCG